jgi:hypothetical protein
MPVTKLSPIPGISSSRTSLSLVPANDLTAADAVALGLVALAFEVFDERPLELEGRVVGPDVDLLYTSTSVPSLPP